MFKKIKPLGYKVSLYCRDSLKRKQEKKSKNIIYK